MGTALSEDVVVDDGSTGREERLLWKPQTPHSIAPVASTESVDLHCGQNGQDLLAIAAFIWISGWLVGMTAEQIGPSDRSMGAGLIGFSSVTDLDSQDSNSTSSYIKFMYSNTSVLTNLCSVDYLARYDDDEWPCALS